MIAIGGAIVGLVVGWIAVTLIGLIDDPPIEILVSLLAPFAASSRPKQLGCSGRARHGGSRPACRYRALAHPAAGRTRVRRSVWQMLIFVVNGLAFLLIGLQLPTVLEEHRGLSAGSSSSAWRRRSPRRSSWCASCWVYPATYLPRWLIPSLARRDPAPPARARLILGWGGMRGAVSLAAALALPLVTNDGEPLPGRGLVIFLAFAVILVTLIGQGLTLPLLIRRLGVVDDGAVEHEELTRARWRRRPRWSGSRSCGRGSRSPAAHRPAQGAVRASWRAPRPRAPGRRPRRCRPDPEQIEEHRARRDPPLGHRGRALAVLELRDRGEISDDALRRVEAGLDLDELRSEA